MFKTLTTGSGSNAVIMGRKTWDSIPAKFRPLPDRLNIVLSRSAGGENAPAGNGGGPKYPAGVVLCDSVPSALQAASSCDKAFVIGGGEIYRQFLPEVEAVYLTEVQGYEGEMDAFFPKLAPGDWNKEDVGGGEKQDKKSELKYERRASEPRPSERAALLTPL